MEDTVPSLKSQVDCGVPLPSPYEAWVYSTVVPARGLNSERLRVGLGAVWDPPAAEAPGGGVSALPRGGQEADAPPVPPDGQLTAFIAHLPRRHTLPR